VPGQERPDGVGVEAGSELGARDEGRSGHAGRLHDRLWHAPPFDGEEDVYSGQRVR
jgi:hypothetical protein